MKLENFTNVTKWVEAELRKPETQSRMRHVNRDEIIDVFVVPDRLNWDVPKTHPRSNDDFWMVAEFQFGEHNASVSVGVSQYKDGPIRGEWALKINYADFRSGGGSLPTTFDETKAAA